MNTSNEIPNRKMNIFTISVPMGVETSFLRKMSRNMGWRMTVRQQEAEIDPSIMTEEEFFAKIDKAKEQVKNGEMGPKFDSAMDLIEHIKSL